jgi:hypothetical protein
LTSNHRRARAKSFILFSLEHIATILFRLEQF